MKKLTLETKTDILFAIFIACLIAANLLGSKITTILGISISVAIFTYPFSFLITDIITEVYGKKKAYNLILGGFIALIFLLGITYLSVKLQPNERYSSNESYVLIFSASLRMIIASLTAFILAQLHDVWAFHFWKKKTQGKFLWLRNNASTIVSQFIDTTVFIFIAFYQIAPKFDFSFMWHLIIPYYLFKVAFAILDTPVCYLGVKWLKNNQEPTPDLIGGKEPNNIQNQK
ncbi:queuosine precursor transporter [Patescibacteria group bacterium]|nr:queuosine precursor transporter [Patescibacteria group bacterium]